MIDDAIAVEQISRLKGLRGFPRGDDSEAARNELYIAARAAASDTLLERVVTDWLGEQHDAPKPTDLRRLIWEENEKVKPASKPAPSSAAHCPTCRDFGIAESIDAADLHSIASYCSCSAGRRRANESDRDQCSPDRVNRARSSLLRIHAGAPSSRTRRELAAKEARERLRHTTEVVADDYRGDF